MSNKNCPRCGDELVGFPALSRWDNQTYICSGCGTDEAMLQYLVAAQDKQGVLDPVLGFVTWATAPQERK